MSASAASPVAKTTAINIHIPKVTFVTTRWGVVTNPADKANAVRDYIKKANDCYSKLKTAGEDGKYLRYVKLKASLEGVAKLLIDTPSCATEGQKIQKLIEHTSKKIKSMNVVNLQKQADNMKGGQFLAYKSQSGNHWYAAQIPGQSLTALSLDWDVTTTIRQLKNNSKCSARDKSQILYNMHQAYVNLREKQTLVLRDEKNEMRQAALQSDLRETEKSLKKVGESIQELIADEHIYTTLQELSYIEKEDAVFNPIAQFFDPTGAKQVRTILSKLRAPGATEENNDLDTHYRRQIKRIASVLDSIAGAGGKKDVDVVAFMKKEWGWSVEQFPHLPNADAAKRHQIVQLLWQYTVNNKRGNFNVTEQLAFDYLMNFFDPNGTKRACEVTGSLKSETDFHVQKGALLTQLKKFSIDPRSAVEILETVSTFSFVLERLKTGQFSERDFSNITQAFIRKNAQFYVKMDPETLMKIQFDPIPLDPLDPETPMINQFEQIPSVKDWIDYQTCLQNWVTGQILSLKDKNDRVNLITAFHVFACQLMEKGDFYTSHYIYQGATSYHIKKEEKEAVLDRLQSSQIKWDGDWKWLKPKLVVGKLADIFSGFGNFKSLKSEQERVGGLQIPFVPFIAGKFARLREQKQMTPNFPQAVQHIVNLFLAQQESWKSYLDTYPHVTTEVVRHSVSDDALAKKANAHK